MKKIFTFLFVIAALAACNQKEDQNSDIVIAFGSCSKQIDSLQIWPQIMQNNPDYWIWLGDNIYGDTYDMEFLKSQYDIQKNNPGYQQLISKTKVYGTWDDHDYGINDGGKEYPKKEESKLLALEFLDVPTTGKVYQHSGIYQSYDLKKGDIDIKLILLDTRSFRDTLIANPAGDTRYLQNEEGSILGYEQWIWLENELKNSTSDVNIIGSSIQFVSKEHAYEKWENFPNERKKMIELIQETKPEFTFFISGDRHIAEISKLEVDRQSYPIYDITSSGLTHTWGIAQEEANQFRIGNMHVSRNFGLIKVNDKKEVFIELRDNSNQILQQIQIKRKPENPA